MTDRNAGYEWRDRVLEKWSTDTDQVPFGCGNLDLRLAWVGGQSMWLTSNELACRPWGSWKSMSDMIRSPSLLYRLACTFPATVRTTGADGYKSVWHLNVIHSSGVRIGFGEHKGAAGFWSDFHSLEDIPSPELLADLKDLIDYLVSDVCAHPYDGLVAGNIA